MFRILSALLLALFCHLLLLLLPFPQPTLPPQLPGKKGIEVQLYTQKNTPPAPPVPLQPVPVESVSPVSTVIAKPPEPIPETIIPKATAVIRIRDKNQKNQLPHIATPSVSPQKKAILLDTRPQQNVPRPTIVAAIPLYEQNPKPEYPSLARRRNWQGTVILSVVVAVDGKGKSIQIHTSSGHGILDKSALQSVNSWHFRPGMRGDTAVEMNVLVPVHFRLND